MHDLFYAEAIFIFFEKKVSFLSVRI